MASPFEDLVAGGAAHQREVRQKLVTFTEPDCKILVDALQVLREEHLLTEVELGKIDRLIERLS